MSLPTIYEEECYEQANMPRPLSYSTLAVPDSPVLAHAVDQQQLCAEQAHQDGTDQNELLLAAIEVRLQQLLYIKAQRQAAVAAAHAAQQQQQQQQVLVEQALSAAATISLQQVQAMHQLHVLQVPN